MINAIEEYVDSLDNTTRRSVVDSWEKFSSEGVIGDEPIRQHAEKLMEKIGSQDRVVFWMKELVFEIFRQEWDKNNDALRS